MKKQKYLLLLILFFALAPVYLAAGQKVPTQSVYQQVVLLVSLGAFGSMLGQFVLSRRLARNPLGISMSGVVRIHRIIGYVAGSFFLVHPVLMVARRFWVLESNPVDNFFLMLRTLALLPAIVAWCLMVVLIVLTATGMRKRLRGQKWRLVHGALSSGLVVAAAWHVIRTGRHSSVWMTVFWVLLAAWAIVPLLVSYLPARSTKSAVSAQGAIHEAI